MAADEDERPGDRLAAVFEVDVRELVGRREREAPDRAVRLSGAHDEREPSGLARATRTAKKEQARRRRRLQPCANGIASRVRQPRSGGDVALPCPRNLDQEPVLGRRRGGSELLARQLGEVRAALGAAHPDSSTQMT